METYNLILTIDPADMVTIIEAGEKIMIGKTVSENSPPPSLAWLSFQPLETNGITWIEEYAIYASSTQGNITVTSKTTYPAETGSCYLLTNDSQFEGPGNCLVPIQPGQYGALNRFQALPSLTFGLLQAASVNGDNSDPVPVSAESIPANQMAVYSPMPTIWVWLQSALQSDARLAPDEAISAPAIVTFTPETASQTLHYDSAQGMFVPAS